MCSVSRMTASATSSHLSELPQGGQINFRPLLRMPVFVALRTLNSSFPWQIVVAGMLLELPQHLALVLNPHIGGEEALQNVFYFFHLPFWDALYSRKPLPYEAVVALFYAAVGVVWVACGMLGAFLLLFHSPSSKLAHVVSCVVHFVTVPLFFPLLQALTFMLGCTSVEHSPTRNHVLWVQPSHSCFTPSHSAHFAVSVVSLVALVGFTHFVLGTVFIFDEGQVSPRARSHTYLDRCGVIYKVGAVVAYQLLISRRSVSLYLCIILVLSLLLAAAHALVLPAFRMWVNRFNALMYSVCAACAAVALLQEKLSDRQFVESGEYHVVLAALVLVVSGAFLLLCRARINGTVQHLLDASLHSSFVPPEENPFAVAAMAGDPNLLPFPQGLPRADALFSPLRYVERDIVEELIAIEEEGKANSFSDQPKTDISQISCVAQQMQKHKDRVQVVAPFISRVVVPTDAELATRFLGMWKDTTGVHPTAQMLAFAARIYTKTLMKFHRSATVTIHFANFLVVYAPSHSRLNLSLHMLEDLSSKSHCDLPQLFMLFSVSLHIKGLLNIRDKAQQRRLSTVSQLHRETLAQMASLWRTPPVPQLHTDVCRTRCKPHYPLPRGVRGGLHQDAHASVCR